MKKFVLTSLLVACMTTFGFAQEEPIPPKRSKAVRVGLFGGFTPGWLSVDVGPLNEFIQSGKGAALKDNGVFLYGGTGAAYILLIPNFRVGGVGMSGSIKSTSLDASNVRRDAELTVGFGGVTFEYVIPVLDRLDVAIGTMLGTGGIDLTLRQSNGGNNTWVGEQNYLSSGLGAPGNNVTRKLSGSYFVWVPSVNVEYAVLGWLGVRLGASYVGMSAPSWQVDSKYELLGVPSKVSGKGFMVNAGVFLGTY